MTTGQQKRIQRIVDGKSLEWLRLMGWPSLIRAQHQVIQDETEELQEMRTVLKDSLEKERKVQALFEEFRVNARDAMAETAELRKERADLNELRAKITVLTTELLQSRLEAERFKTELSHAKMNEKVEASNHATTRGHLIKVLEWIHATHRLSSPPHGIRALLSMASRRVPLLFLLLIPMLLEAAPFPGLFRNSWTTNSPGTPVKGVDNLSVTNVGSGTNWEFHKVGPNTIARLTDVSNVVAGIPAATTYIFNTNQFATNGSLNVSVKKGARLTNSYTINATNSSHLTMESGSIFLWDGGLIQLEEDVPGGNLLDLFGNFQIFHGYFTMSLMTPSRLAVWDGNTFLTNGTLSESDINAKQFGLAALTNLAGTVANNVTNLVSLSTTNATSKPLTNSYTAGVVTIRGLEAGTGITLTANGSNYVHAIDASVVASQANLTAASNALAALVGETNWNGEVSVTNGTRIGLVNGKANNTNLLRSVQGGNGITLTNQGTNVMFAIDPAVVASQSNLTGASNALAALVGETNYNGEVSVTNATRMGWVNDKVNNTNRLRSIMAGNGITLTNEGTNIMVALTSAAGEANVNGEVSLTNATVMGWVYDKIGITNRLRSIRPGNGITLTNESTNVTVAVTATTATYRAWHTEAGNTVNATIQANTTWFTTLKGWPTNATSDTSLYTRTLLSENTLFTNLYVRCSAAPGSGKTTTYTILTNGVSTGFSQTIAGTSATAGTNLTGSVSVPAGIEVGISIATQAASTVALHSWAVSMVTTNLTTLGL